MKAEVGGGECTGGPDGRQSLKAERPESELDCFLDLPRRYSHLRPPTNDLVVQQHRFCRF